MITNEYLDGLQRRALTAAAPAAATDTMEVSGIGVPYNQPTTLAPGLQERIAPAAIIPNPHRMLFWRHSEPIGLVTDETETDTDWSYRASISDTQLGRDAHTLAKDGVIKASSIGFIPLEWKEEQLPDGSTLITHTKIDVREVSLVPIPAYAEAKLTEVRHQPNPKETPVMDTTETQITELRQDINTTREGLDDLTRAVALLNREDTPAAQPFSHFPSFGAFVKELASGNDLATRAFEGAVSGDTILKDQWVGDVIRLVEDRYRITGLFNRTTDLPAEGNTLEYGVLAADTITVAEQATEGDDLAFGKIALATRNAQVKTYGGWSALSAQAISRASVGVLDVTFKALAKRYGRAIETATRTLFSAAHTAALASTADKVMLGDATPTALASADADTWLATVLALMEHYDAKGYNLDGLIASKDVMLALAACPEEKKMLQIAGAPDDKTGTLTVSIPSANLYGLRVAYAPYLSAGTLAAYDAEALRIQESPGAPFRLQDANIVNLTQQFSVYGYAAHYQQLEGGIVAIDING